MLPLQQSLIVSACLRLLDELPALGELQHLIVRSAPEYVVLFAFAQKPGEEFEATFMSDRRGRVYLRVEVSNGQVHERIRSLKKFKTLMRDHLDATQAWYTT